MKLRHAQEVVEEPFQENCLSFHYTQTKENENFQIKQTTENKKEDATESRDVPLLAGEKAGGERGAGEGSSICYPSKPSSTVALY